MKISKPKDMKNLTIYILSTLFLVSCAPEKKSTPPALRSVESSVIYEVNIRQYTPEGTFQAFSKHLPRLKQLGVDILWLMPVYPISEKFRKGTLGSYYAVKDYRKVNPEFGTPEDLKQLVAQAHELGFRVILDWVANHTGWDNPLIEQHPDWYTHKDGKIISPVEDWADVADLNYDNPEMREYMVGSLQYWLREADIDGFRCDMAAMVPTDFWEATRPRLDSIKPVFMLAEAWEPELTRKAFDACYGWELHHLMNDIAQGEKDGSDLLVYFQKVDTLYSKHTMLLNFLDNHDENSWNGTIQSRMGEAQKVFATLAWTVPGIPLIYTGQEVGLNKSLKFFDKDEVNWQNDTTLTVFYRQLNELKHQSKALNAGIHKGDFHILSHDNEKNVFAYERKSGTENLIIILNLTDKIQHVSFNGKLQGNYADCFTKEKIPNINDFKLQPYDYKVLSH